MGLFDSIFGNRNRKPEKAKYAPIDYNQYFDNLVVDNIPIELLHLGELNLITGEIIACDPLVCLYDALPFTKTVSPGKYPVIICVAKTENSGDRYAIAKLRFNDEKAVKWELALTGKQDVNELKEIDEYFGFPVDAGLGCFCDVKTQKRYNEFATDFMLENPQANIYDDYFAAEFKRNAIDQNDLNDIGDWLNFSIPNQPDLNVIMFHSGYGDGAYPCFWGISAAGKICSLIIDFQVF